MIYKFYYKEKGKYDLSIHKRIIGLYGIIII